MTSYAEAATMPMGTEIVARPDWSLRPTTIPRTNPELESWVRAAFPNAGQADVKLDMLRKARDAPVEVGYEVITSTDAEMRNLLDEAATRLSSPSDPNSYDRHYSDLHLRAAIGDTRRIEALLRTHLDVNSERDQCDWTAVHYAALTGQATAVRLLLNHDETRPEGATADTVAARANASTRDGTSPLMMAARGGHLEIVMYLLSVDADPNSLDKIGALAMHHAAFHGHVGVASALCERESGHLNATTNFNDTPLMLAAMRNHRDMVTFLLTEGALAGYENIFRKRAIDLCPPGPVHDQIETKSRDMTALGANVQSVVVANLPRLLETVRTGTLADVRRELGTGGVPDGSAAAKLLREAIVAKKVDIIEHFLPSLSVDMLNYPCGLNMRASVAEASAQGLTSIVQALVGKGALTALLDQDRRTPLMLAAEARSEPCVTYLLSLGLDSARPQHQDKNLDTALHTAATGPRPISWSIFKKIYDAWPPAIDFINRAKESPLSLALQEGGRPYEDDFDSLRRKTLDVILSKPIQSVNERFGEKGQPLLHLSMLIRDPATFRKLRERGAQVNVRNDDGESILISGLAYNALYAELLDNKDLITDISKPGIHGGVLHLAAENGKRDTDVEKSFNLLIRSANRPPIDAVNQHGQTALMISSRQGPFQFVRTLIANDAVFTLADKLGDTPLHYAAGHVDDRTDIIGHLFTKAKEQNDKLIRNKQPPLPPLHAARNSRGWTPLHTAVSHGNADNIQLLLDCEADIEAVTNLHETPLFLAVKAHRNVPGVVKILLQAGANPRTRNRFGSDAASVADSLGRPKLGDYLRWLSRRVVARVLSPVELSALSLPDAARRGKADQVAALLAARTKDGKRLCDINEKYLGYTAIQWAAINGYLAVVNRLVSEEGVNINELDQVGWTPLHYAIHNKHSTVVDKLLETANRSCASTKTKETALHLAVSLGRTEYVQLLLRDPATVSAIDSHGNLPIHLSLDHDTLDVFEALVGAGSPLNVANRDGDTVVHLAVRNTKARAVEILAQRGGVLTAAIMNKSQWTPIHEAALKGSVECLNILLTDDATVDLRNQKNQTPLHCAALVGQSVVARVLLDRGADPNACDAKQCTPLLLACRATRLDAELVKMLLRNGAHPSIADINGQRPRDCTTNSEMLRWMLYAEDLMTAAREGDLKRLSSVLMESQPEKVLDWSLPEGRQLIHVAVENNQPAVVGFIISQEPASLAAELAARTPRSGEAGQAPAQPQVPPRIPYVNAQTKTTLSTPLHLAAIHGMQLMTGCLIAMGADVSARNKAGQTPIMHAARTGSGPITAALVSGLWGPVDVTLKDAEDRTALHYAALCPTGCASLLDALAPKELLNQEDKSGHTPLFLASATGNPDTTKRLLDLGADPNYCSKIHGSKASEVAKTDAVKALFNASGDTPKERRPPAILALPPPETPMVHARGPRRSIDFSSGEGVNRAGAGGTAALSAPFKGDPNATLDSEATQDSPGPSPLTSDRGNAVPLPGAVNGVVEQIVIDLDNYSMPRVNIEKFVNIRVKWEDVEWDPNVRTRSGGFGAVAKGRYLYEDVAIKRAVRADGATVNMQDIVNFVHEACVLDELRHQHVVGIRGILYRVNEESGLRECAIMMEWAHHGDLFAAVMGNQKPEPRDRIRYVQDACKGLDYIHRKGIPHRDIKPANIVLFDGPRRTMAKLCDFGLSGRREIGGFTRMYVPPEDLIRGKVADRNSDIYSMGLTLCMSMIGEYPFPGDQKDADFRANLLAPPKEVPNAEQNALVRYMCHNDPDQRPKAGEVVARLEQLLVA